ncbi:hypothetical protein [Agrobacterium fabrum]|jgi:hypothetical protein|uniref:hypothetical protein n=1 Tax=Agrobacterium fabrum TaxID=1176649 RepID=UPI0013CE73F8|nr:hypothetical protein [Agrobacterium fabrum]NTE63429.1 hypothetical protein [Agrobacterium fabrum]WCK77923.1 hypothetical protein G6L39_014595 [Agrobacterium fabrum]
MGIPQDIEVIDFHNRLSAFGHKKKTAINIQDFDAVTGPEKYRASSADTLTPSSSRASARI